MASNGVFQSASGRGWRAGLGNMLRKEMHDWWGTRSWIGQTILWLAIVNGLLATVLFVAPAQNPSEVFTPDVGPILFFTIGSMALSIGTIILAQDEIVGEKKAGTAAWILTKPVSRSAFVLSKLLANALGILVVMVLFQGAAGYALMSIAQGSALPVGPYLLALLLLFLSLMFYLTLGIMLGTLFDKGGPVIGIPMILVFTYQMAGAVPLLGQIMPWRLAVQNSPDFSLAVALVTGQPLPSLVPVIATVIWCALFIGVAIWRFEREEF